MRNKFKNLIWKFAQAWIFSSATPNIKLSRIVEKFDVVEKVPLRVRIKA
jgi:hypothetical protein